MTDTHSHIYLPEYDFSPDDFSERQAVVARASDAGVNRIIFPNIDRESVPAMLGLHRLFPDNTFVTAGLHPTEVAEDWQQETEEIFSLMSEYSPVAVGEVGIDLYWDRTFADLQIEAFAWQVDKARQMNLPVIIHQREALEETLSVLCALKEERPVCVFHSFTGNISDAERIMALGRNVYFGINGVATFKNAGELRSAIPVIGINNIILETDAPYLAPVPRRGKTNESSYLPYTASVVADALGVSVRELETVTDSTASEVFGI